MQAESHGANTVARESNRKEENRRMMHKRRSTHVAEQRVSGEESLMGVAGVVST
jgi:hypothetical protein